MPDRRGQIILLLGSRFDLLWFPGGALRTQPGLAPSKRVPCPQCGSGERPGWQIEKRGGIIVRQTPCGMCGGVGGEKPKPGKGVVAVDPMDTTRTPVGSSDTHASARPRKRVKCDGCQDHDGTPSGVIRGERCPYCDGTGWRDLHRFDLQLDVRENQDVGGIAAAIDRRNDAGSYHQLDLALAGVVRHVNKPLMYAALTVNAASALRLLDELYLPPTTKTEDQLSRFEWSLVELAVAYIDSRMPDPIVVPRDVTLNARQMREHRTRAKGRTGPLKVRDTEIRKLARAGKGAQWIAAEYGLHVSSVYEIVNGSREPVA